ncbi:hypothetical protein P4B35_10035 [Pontiellaceae bacterium B12227]|nr:hypothetical protein [Pontiellaceae bacterium B12227]
MNKTKNIIMIAVAAAVLVALNVGVFMAAGNGAMSPINDLLLWGGFVALNVASILWAVSLLGLQPLVVTLSYVAGGALAFLGVRSMPDISVAEITTAGATYGAFGALAVGNFTTKVRLAFFNKGQVPFIFIIVGLLVVDGVLNSQVSSAGVPVLLNAILIPFIVAGAAIGLIWSGLNRFGIGKKPSEVLAEKSAVLEVSQPVKATTAKSAVIPMPDHAVVAEKPVAAPQPVKKVEPIAPAAKAKSAAKAKPAAKPKKAKKAAAPPKKQAVAAKPAVKEEQFFPLEIDKSDEIILPPEEKAAFEVPSFDAALYASGSQGDQAEGGVMVKEPAAAVEAQPEKPAVAEAKPEPVKEDRANDFLSGHLDLLNKLK